MTSLALLINQLSSLYMVGVIWVIQLIHYPSFAHIATTEFNQFHSRHTLSMSILVGPVMIAELLAASWLVFDKFNILTCINFSLVAALWLLTFFISVPLHNRLSQGLDPLAVQNLINTNWPRTLIWTAKAVLAVFWTTTGKT